MPKKTLDQEIDELLDILPSDEEIKKETWEVKQQQGQERRSKTNWSEKMVGNTNGASPDNPRFKGKKHKEESRKKTSESMKGKNHGTLVGVPKPKETCLHCGKIGGRPQMLQYHFDRCKFKKD
jgi:hypothetical protein